MTYRRAILVFSLGCCVVVSGLLGASRARAAGPAAWEATQSTNPTVLVPGSHGFNPESAVNGLPNATYYQQAIVNVGGSAANEVTITDTLSSGVSIAPSSPLEPTAYYQTPLEGREPENLCSVTGQTVTCETGEVPVGAVIKVVIHIDVPPAGPTSVRSDLTVSSLGSTPLTNSLTSAVSAETPAFGYVDSRYGLWGSAFTENGLPSVAGGHPFSVQLGAHIPVVSKGGTLLPAQSLRNVEFTLPNGFVVNPQAVRNRCPLFDLQGPNDQPKRACPRESIVGKVTFTIIPGLELGSPLYVLVPPNGVPAEFAFAIQGTVVHIQGALTGNFHLAAQSNDLIAKYPIDGFHVELWGVPSDPRHNFFRANEGELTTVNGEAVSICAEINCSVPPNPYPLVSMPTSCSELPKIAADTESWLAALATGSAGLSDSTEVPETMKGCDSLAFEPSIKSSATTEAAEAASGLAFSIHQPQNEELDGRSNAALKDATVTLPEGLTLNPAAGDGLGSCTEAEMGYSPEEGHVRFSTAPQTCPNAAKVGTVEVSTPLLDHKLPGAIYLAKPFENPFDSLIAIYLAVEDEQTGIVAKLAGRVTPAADTGRLTARFEENPQLPVEDIELEFFGGSRGALTTPLTCGSQSTATTLVPWSSPEAPDAHPTSSFVTSEGCASSEAAAPKSFGFAAGTGSPLAGSYSPFVLRLTRPDGSQHFTGIETKLPEGLLGKLAGVTYCPEAGIAQAKSREQPEQGRVEQRSPSCPASSEVGTVRVLAGSGSSPIPVSGHAYLAGPYKGAPLSLVVVVPAVAGPFDLGTVVSRIALKVGEYDARIQAVSDQLPTILDGIPLDVRSIEVELNRPSFTLNPTSCEEMAIEGSVATQAGQATPIKNRFQVGECGRLAFKPKLALSLKGPTKRTGHPALKAVLTYPKKGRYANIARAQVSLPHSEFLDQNNIGKACTKPLLAARACPAKSIYGKARAWTPLLEKPLEGPVYLVGGFGYKLPALVAELNGQIRVLLVGKVDSDKRKGIRNTFEAAPDAPVERFVLELKGGKKYGLLVNSENICQKVQKAGVAFRAQNGRTTALSVKIANSCRRTGKSSGHHRHER